MGHPLQKIIFQGFLQDGAKLKFRPRGFQRTWSGLPIRKKTSISTLPKIQLFHRFFINFRRKTKKNRKLLPPIRYQTTLQHLRFIVSEPRPERSTATPISAESTLGSSLGPTEGGSSLGPTERGLIQLVILSTSLFFAPPGMYLQKTSDKREREREIIVV